MNIVLFGPQGCGKGTQAKLLEKRYKIPHISTGDIFWENVRNNTELGKKANQIIDSGNLVPDEITNAMMEERLRQEDAKKGFILDGYPRNLNQAEFLDSLAKVDFFINIEIPDELAIKRLSSRRSCSCGAVYNLITNPPKKDNLCDRCGKPLFQRDDDKPEAIKKRLEIYHKEKKPILEFYRKKGVYHLVDGNQPVEKVFQEIIGALEKKG